MSMHNQPVDKISIVIPIYNIAPYLRNCIESCLNQTYANIEIICVDDGSTDESGKIADEYASIDSRIRVIHKKNGGLPSARKAGIEAASGGFIFHLDGDDDIPSDAIERLISVAGESKDLDIVVGDYNVYGQHDKCEYMSSRLDKTISGNSYVNFILKEGLFNIWGKLIRRSLYKDYPIEIPLDISLGEDLVAMTQLAFYARRVAPCRFVTYNYYVRPTSMSLYSDQAIGELTNRSIYAVVFITRFLNSKVDERTSLLLRRYIEQFIYIYMRSPYPVSLRKVELQQLCKYYQNHISFMDIRSFRDFVCWSANYNLVAAKILGKCRNVFR